VVIKEDALDSFTMGDLVSFLPSSNSSNTTNIEDDSGGGGGFQEMIACSLASLDSGEFLDLSAVLKMQGISFQNVHKAGTNASDYSLEDDIDGLFNNILSLTLSEYDELVSGALAGLVAGPVRQGLNTQIQALIEELDPNEACPSTDGGYSGPKLVDFDSSSLLHDFNDLLASDNAIINKYLGCLQNYANGVFQTSLGSLGILDGYKFHMEQIVLDNVDSLSDLGILSPIDGFRLENRLAFGNSPLTAKGVIHVSSHDLDAKLNLTFQLGNVSLASGALIKYDQNLFNILSVETVFDDLRCLGAPAAEWQFLGFMAGIGNLDILVDMNMTRSAVGPYNFSISLGSLPSAQDVAVAVIEWLPALVQDLLNSMVTSAKISDTCADTGSSSHQDTNSSSTDEDGDSNDIAVLIVVLTLFVGGNAFGIPKRRRRSMRLHTQEDLSEPLILPKRVEDSPSIRSILMFHPSVPISMRYLIPILAIGTIALLLASNVGVGASVDVSMVLPNGDVLALPSMFAFSLGNTVRDMYEAKIYALMLLVVVFSGIWPYVKLALMVLAWCAPISVLSIGLREKLLVWLDALGKFSLVDTYVLVLMLVAFRYHLELGDFGTLDVYVTPLGGFYGFLLVIILSLIGGHVILHLHRNATAPSKVDLISLPEAVSDHVFEHPDTKKRMKLSSRFKQLVFLLIIVTITLMGIGIVQKSFVFEFGGIAGLLLGDDRIQTYSLFSLGQSLPSSVANPSSFGIHFIQATYHFYAIVTPIVCLVLTFALFGCPMTAMAQERVFVLTEIANAWSAAEVFVLSIVASLFEISTFAAFMIGDKCDLLNEIVEQSFDSLVDGDDKCFTVQSSLRWSSCFLLCSVVLNAVVVYVILRLTRHVIQDRRSKVVDSSSLVHSLMKSSFFSGFIFVDAP